MKQSLIIIVILVIAGLGTWLYLRDSVSYVPEWYQSEAGLAPQGDNSAAMRSFRTTVEDAYYDLGRGIEVSIGEDALNGAVLGLLQEGVGGSPEMVRAIRSEIREDQVAVDLILDADEIPWERLGGTYRLLRQLAGLQGEGGGRNLYVGLRGKPALEQGRLQFGEEAKIQVGQISYPLDRFIDQVGLRDDIDSQLGGGRLMFNSVRLEDGRIVLER